MDRIDMHIEVPAVPYKELRGKTDGTPSVEIRQRVEDARETQRRRGFYNSQIPHAQLRTLCALDESGERTLELAVRLPPRLKARGLSLKRVLKEAVEDLVPSEILRRPKKGFGVPLDRWFREDLRAYVDSTLGAVDARVKEHLAPDAVDRLIAEHQSRAQNHGHALWTLLTLEVFLRGETV